jgi:hypothetical protein
MPAPGELPGALEPARNGLSWRIETRIQISETVPDRNMNKDIRNSDPGVTDRLCLRGTLEGDTGICCILERRSILAIENTTHSIVNIFYIPAQSARGR